MQGAGSNKLAADAKVEAFKNKFVNGSEGHFFDFINRLVLQLFDG